MPEDTPMSSPMTTDAETFVCVKCGTEYPLTPEYFSRCSIKKNGFRSDCKKCQRAADKKYKDENRQHIRESNRKYQQSHKEEIKKNRSIEYGRHYWGDVEYSQRTGWELEPTIKYTEEDAAEYRKKIAYRERRYSPETLRKNKERSKKWKAEHHDWVIEDVKRRQHENYVNDPIFRDIMRVRTCINKSFERRGVSKVKRNSRITGLSTPALYEHLLQTFEDIYGYPWDHKEPVHIDHIIPLATANTTEEVEKLCHYTNLRLIKAEDNLRKNKRLDYEITTPQERM